VSSKQRADAVGAPTTYRRPVSRLWWLKKRTYLLFVLREFTCVFVAWAVVFLALLVYAIGRGAAAYARFLDWASTPAVVVVNVVALVFLVVHTVTWFALTPQAMVVRGPGSRPAVVTRMVPVGGRIMPSATVIRVGGRVPGALVIASQYAGLVVVSAFIAWLVVW
jgi:fumarate reductase subunit C